MGRKPLIEERKHPFYFRPGTSHGAPGAGSQAGEHESAEPGPKEPEFFMEQVMEGLSDACILVDGTDRILYVNTSAKTLLRPRGRILGRKLESVLADRRLSMLAADAYHTGKPIFSRLALPLPGERWRDDHDFHLSLVPLFITPVRRLVRIALRSTQRESPPVSESRPGSADRAATLPETRVSPVCSDTMLQLKNPLSIVQGYLENMLDGVINDPVAMRQSLLTMRKHTLIIERLLEGCQKS